MSFRVIDGLVIATACTLSSAAPHASQIDVLKFFDTLNNPVGTAFFVSAPGQTVCVEAIQLSHCQNPAEFYPTVSKQNPLTDFSATLQAELREPRVLS